LATARCGALSYDSRPGECHPGYLLARLRDVDPHPLDPSHSRRRTKSLVINIAAQTRGFCLSLIASRFQRIRQRSCAFKLSRVINLQPIRKLIVLHASPTPLRPPLELPISRANLRIPRTIRSQPVFSRWVCHPESTKRRHCIPVGQLSRNGAAELLYIEATDTWGFSS
jgi:hypothetical protein